MTKNGQNSTYYPVNGYNLYYRRLIMDKYIGFDIDSKKTIACVVQRGKKRQIHNIKNADFVFSQLAVHFRI